MKETSVHQPKMSGLCRESSTKRWSKPRFGVFHVCREPFREPCAPRKPRSTLEANSLGAFASCFREDVCSDPLSRSFRGVFSRRGNLQDTLTSFHGDFERSTVLFAFRPLASLGGVRLRERSWVDKSCWHLSEVLFGSVPPFANPCWDGFTWKLKGD